MPEPIRPERESLVAALAEMADDRIGGAQLFGTYTFRDPEIRPGSPYYTSVGHAGAVRSVERYFVTLADLNPGVSAFVAMEPHKDRVAPHFHALIAGLSPDVVEAVELVRRGGSPDPGAQPAARHAPDLIWRQWYEAHGIARIEKVEGDGAALYVSKYSNKLGDGVPYWRLWEPGELRNQWAAPHRSRRG